MLSEEIKVGVLPVAAMKKLIADTPDISNFDLGVIFKNEFPLVGGEVRQIISYWGRPGKRPGIDDDKLNYLLLNQLFEAGYLDKNVYQQMIMMV